MGKAPFPAQQSDLEHLSAIARRRSLAGRAGADFASNDYLGLAGSRVLADAVQAALDRGVPVGSGGSRLLRFIAITSIVAYSLQMLVELVVPAQLGARLVGPNWYGLDPAIAAIAIAWACTYKGETVNLLFLGPVSGRTLILVVLGFALLRLAAANQPEEGLLSPFFGMLVGWGIGGGTPSPLRKAWLKLRLAQLEGRQAKGPSRSSGPRKARPNPGGLRVIPGGRSEDDDDKGPDGRWLN